MLKFFARGEKSAGSELSRLLLAVQAHAFSAAIDVTEAFIDVLVERLDAELRARHVPRFAGFAAAVASAEAVSGGISRFVLLLDPCMPDSLNY